MAGTDIIKPVSEVTSLTPEQHAARQKVIGGSEVATLFGLGYKTKLELWLEKAGEIEPEELSSEALERGVFMEPSIAAWAAHRTGYTLRKVSKHMVHPENSGWGGNLDYQVVDHPNGEAPCEIKSVNFFQGKRSWILNTDDMEAPPHIELQLHHQIGLTQANWGIIAADVGGELVIIERERSPHFLERIGEEIDEFWETIRKGEPPEPSLEKDLKTLQRLYPDHTPEKVAPLDDDMRQYLHDLELGRQYKAAGEKLADAAKTGILWLAGDAELVDLGDWVGDGEERILSLATVHRKGFTVEPSSSRQVTIKKKPKEKKDAKAKSAGQGSS